LFVQLQAAPDQFPMPFLYKEFAMTPNSTNIEAASLAVESISMKVGQLNYHNFPRELRH
jgi:hypothetical protein